VFEPDFQVIEMQLTPVEDKVLRLTRTVPARDRFRRTELPDLARWESRA
jgi:hypothetical protein